MIAVPNYISPEEYLDIERQNPLRHEYRQGLVYAMSGGSDNHDRIAFNFLKLIDNHLGDATECRSLGARSLGDYVGVASPPEISPGSHRYIKRYPKLITEVLSPSTEVFDLGEKFEDYKQLETLQEYVLISQDQQQVECRRRTNTNTWETVIYQSDDRVFLSSINLEFDIAKLYRGLD
jgi:Uma2 family endonuclease